MKKIIYLKLGGSLVTNKQKAYTFNEDIVKQIAAEIAETVREQSNLQLVLGNGAGSFAHQSAAKYNLKDGVTTLGGKYGAAVTHQDATYLNHLITHIFHQSSLPVFSLQPSAYILASNRSTTQIELSVFEKLITQDMIPFIYGDVIIDTEVGATVYSTDRLLREIAQKHINTVYQPSLIIHAGNYDGVLDKNNSVISHITPRNYNSVQQNFYNSSNVDVTGGMEKKVDEMLKLAAHGIPSIILNGSKKGLLKETLAGAFSSGTYISSS